VVWAPVAGFVRLALREAGGGLHDRDLDHLSTDAILDRFGLCIAASDEAWDVLALKGGDKVNF
jgi:hypothetical protein